MQIRSEFQFDPENAPREAPAPEPREEREPAECERPRPERPPAEARPPVVHAVALVALLVAAVFTGCSGSGGTANTVAPAPTASPTPVVTASPTPVVTASPGPGTISLAPNPLNFATTGAAAAQTFTASETGFSGTYSATTAAAGTAGSCSGIATISPTSGSGTFTVTPVAAGGCVFTVSDGTHTAPETINITTTTVGGT